MMTDQEIDDLFGEAHMGGVTGYAAIRSFARAVEDAVLASIESDAEENARLVRLAREMVDAR